MALHLTPALEQRLDQLAAHTHRSANELAQEGLETFLDYEERSMAIGERGRADVAAGRVMNHDAVADRFTSLKKAG